MRCIRPQPETSSRRLLGVLAVLVCIAASTAANAQMATGTYTGNGASSQQISDLGFQPDVVFVKGDADVPACMSTSTMGAGWGKALSRTGAPASDLFQSLDAGGFTVSSSNNVNQAGVRYDWVAMKADPGRMALGEYGGNGNDDRLIELGFRPDYIIVVPLDADQGLQRSADMPDDFCLPFDNEGRLNNCIQSFADQGFVIGDDRKINASSVRYHYIAWRSDPGRNAVGTYVGNGNDNRDITGAGLAPAWVLTKADSGEDGVHLTASAELTAESLYFGQKKNDPNRIQALLDDGFEIGSDNDANDKDKDYYWAAFGILADLQVSNVADVDTAMVGDDVTFTVTVVNAGPDRARDVQITDKLPTGLFHTGYFVSSGVFDPVSGQWSIPRIDSGDQAVMTLTAQVAPGAAGQDLVVPAGVTAFADNDPDPSNDTASIVVTVIPSANLGVSGNIDDPTPMAGQTVTLSVGAQNLGPDAATSLSVDALLPAGLEYVSHAVSVGSYDPIAGRWSISTLGAWSAAALMIDVRVAGGLAVHDITVPLSISSEVVDPVPLNDTGAVDIYVEGSDLQLTMAVDDPTPGTGDFVTYTLSLANAGPDDAVAAVVAAGIPAGMSYVSSLPSQGIYNAGSATWSAGALATGETATLDLSVRVTTDQAGVIDNAVAVTSSLPADPDPTDNQAEASVDVQGVDVGMTVEVNVPAPNAGDRVIYTVTAANSGQMDGTGLAVTCPLPAGLAYVSDIPSTGSYDPVTGAWSIGTLARGSSQVLLLTADVSPGTGGETIETTAAVTALVESDMDPANDSDSVAIVVRSARLQLIKNVDDPTPVQGEQVVFTVLVVNSGPDDATGVAVADTLPAGLDFVGSTSERGSYDPATGIWDVGSVAAGDTARLDVAVDVQLDVGAGDSAVNTARIISSDQDDPVASDDADTASLTQQSADLNVALSVDDPNPAAGDVVRYTLTVRNDGPGDVHGVVLIDSLAAGLTYVSHAPAGFDYQSTTGLWTLGDLPNGATAIIQIDASVDAGASGWNIVNEAVVSVADQADPDGTDNQAQVAVDVTASDLDLAWTTAASTATVGDVVAARLELTNAGPDDLESARIELVLPAGLTHAGAVPGAGVWDGGDDSWTLGGLSAGATAVLDLDLLVEPGTIGTVLAVEAAKVTARPGDPTPAAVPVRKDVSVIGADLVLDLAANVASAGVGESILYTLTVRNDGPDIETGVSVRDSLPAGLEYVTHIPSWADYGDDDGVWNVGDLQVGESAVLLIQTRLVAAAPGDEVVNAAQVLGRSLADPAPENDAAQAVVDVPAADLALDLTALPENPVMGGAVALTVQVTNNGPEDATGVVLGLPMPGGLEFVSAENPGYDAVGGRWVVGELLAGATRELNLNTTVAQGTAEDTIRIEASVAEVDQGDPAAANDADTARLIVEPDADLGIVVAPSLTVVDVGDTLTWSVHVVNNGPSQAGAVAVSDSLPDQTLLLDWDADQGTYDGFGRWAVGELAPGGSAELRLRVLVAAGSGGSDPVCAAAVGDDAIADQTPGNDVDRTSVHVTGADLTLESYVDLTAPGEDDDVNITLSVANLGPDAAFGVTVRDSLPVGLEYVSHTPPSESYVQGPDGVWTWDVGVVEGQTPRVLFVRTGVAAGATGEALRHAAVVVPGPQEDPDPSNDTAVNMLAVEGADLGLTLAVDDAGPAEGDLLEYVLSLSNLGPKDGSGIIVDCALDEGLGFVEADPGAVYDSGSGVWTVGDLAAGDAVSLVVRARVGDRTGGSRLTCSARIVELDQIDPGVDNDSASAAVDVAIPTSGHMILAATPLEDGTIRPLSGPVGVLSVELVNWAAVNDTLTALTVMNASTGAGDAAQMDASWDGLELWRFETGSWSRISTDDVVFEEATARFEDLGLVLTPGDTLALEVRGRAGAAARDGDRFAVRVDAPDALTFTRAVVVDSDWPLATGADVAVDGFVAAQATLGRVGADVIAPWETDRVVLDVVLPPDGYAPGILNDLQVVNHGTARQDTEIESVRAWVDDGDGELTPGPDVLLGVMAWTGDRWRVSGLSTEIPADGLPVLVSVDASAGADGDNSVQFAIPRMGVEVRGDGDGPLDGDLVNSETLVISGTDRLYMAAVAQPWSIAQADGEARHVLHLTATNTFDEVRTISSLRLTGDIRSPYTDDQAVLDRVVAQLLLRADAGDDGVPGEEDEILAVSSLSSGSAVLGGFEWSVPPSSTRHLFVDARLAPDLAADGDNITISVASAVDVKLGDAGEVAGSWPLDGGGGLVVDGVLAGRILPHPTGVRTAAPGASGLLGLDVTVPSNGHADDTLESVTVVNLGDAGAGDVDGMTLWRDGGNGRFDAGTGAEADDVELSGMSPRFGTWVAENLNETVSSEGRRLYVGVDLDPAAVDSAVVAVSIPLGGLGYASDGDGPIDSVVSSGGSILVSNSVIHVALATDPVEVVTGQDVSVRMTVTNVGGHPLTGVSPTTLSMTGDGVLSGDQSHLPAATDLAPGDSVDFVWVRQASAVGEVALSAGASGLESGATPVTSLPISAVPVRIAEPAPELRLAALSQLPFAVNGGQTDVNALVLDLSHPGAAAAADVRLDSLVIRLEDGEAGPQNAGGVLDRILLRADGALLLAADIDPDAGSVLVLTPESAPFISPSQSRVLTLGLEMSDAAVGTEFRLVLDDGGLSVSDAVGGEPVGVLLDEGSYPVRSELTRVVDGAPALAVAAEGVGTPQASRGQDGVALSRFVLTNPGVVELGAGIQLGVVVVDVYGADGGPLDDPASVIAALDLWHDGVRLARREVEDGSSCTITLPLDTPLNIEAGLDVALEVHADLRSDAPVGPLGLAVPDGTGWDARDANSGVPVSVIIDPAPLVSSPVAVVRPVESVQLGGRPVGASVLTGGSHEQTVLELDVRHAGDAETAAVTLDTLVVRCLDARRRPLTTVAVLDRVSVKSAERTVGEAVATAAPDGLLRIALADVVCGPGGRVLLDVSIDVQANASVDTFLLEVGLEDVGALDVNLRSPVAVTPDLGAAFPLSSGARTIRVAADEMIVTAADLMPATVSSLGEEVAVLSLEMTNTAAVAAGDLALKSVTVQGRIGGPASKSLGGVAGAFVAMHDGEVWGRYDGLAADDSMVVITGRTDLHIGPGRTEQLEIRFEIAEGVSSGSLTVGLGLDDIVVTQPEGDLVTVRVLPADGQTFPFWTLSGSVAPPSLEESYANFPNPFAAGSEATSFVFALTSDSTVDLRVYTPRGELVRTLLSAERRDVGLHQDVAWDGRNGRGDTVRNGVYIAEIVVRASDGGTTTLRRKVAVVR